MYDILKGRMQKYTKDVIKKVAMRDISVEGIRFINVRDCMLTIGDVIEEDEVDQIYIGIIKAGFANRNSALVGTALVGSRLYIISCAKEGLLCQSTAEHAIDKFLNTL